MSVVVLANALLFWLVTREEFWAIDVRALKLCWLATLSFTAITGGTAHPTQGRTFQKFALVQRLVFVMTFSAITSRQIWTFVAVNRKTRICISLQ